MGRVRREKVRRRTAQSQAMCCGREPVFDEHHRNWAGRVLSSAWDRYQRSARCTSSRCICVVQAWPSTHPPSRFVTLLPPQAKGHLIEPLRILQDQCSPHEGSPTGGGRNPSVLQRWHNPLVCQPFCAWLCMVRATGRAAFGRQIRRCCTNLARLTSPKESVSPAACSGGARVFLCDPLLERFAIGRHSS